jgi:uncharacterized protein involved in exopolysaccharide biosynthesis
MPAEIVYPPSGPPVPLAARTLVPAEAKSHFALTLFKWHRLILGFGLVVMVAATIAMLLKPALPMATARILIKAGLDGVPIPGLPTAGGRGGLEFLQTQAELFASRIVLLPVARALREARGAPADDRALESDVASLRADLVVVPVPNTTVIQATKFAPTEAEAQRLLGMIIDSYIDRHGAAHNGSTSVAAFFERETATAAASLKEAEDRLQRWREENNVVAAEQQLIAQLTGVAELEGALKRTDVDLQAAQIQIAALTRDIAALPRESVTSREQMANPLVTRLKESIAAEEATLRDVNRGAVTERLQMEIAAAEVAARDAAATPLAVKLRADLVTAELALGDLRQRYTDEDRRVQEKLEQIDRLREELAAAEREAVAAAHERLQNLRRELTTVQRDVEAAAQQRIASLRSQLAAAEHEGNVFARATVALTPLRETLNRDLATARTRLATLGPQRDGLRAQLQQARTDLAHFQDKRVEAQRITRQVELAQEHYLQNRKRLDDVRLTAGLRKQQLTDIAVIEPPSATTSRPGVRRVALVALLGAIVGLGLGVATALALEFFNWSLQTPEDVEFYLGVPALATVPAMLATRPTTALTAFTERIPDPDGAQRARGEHR